MDTPPTSRRFVTYTVAALLVVLFVLYPLSEGPVTYYLMQHPTAKNEAYIAAFYRPLYSTYKAIPALLDLEMAYVGFWRDLAMKADPPGTHHRRPAEP